MNNIPPITAECVSGNPLVTSREPSLRLCGFVTVGGFFFVLLPPCCPGKGDEGWVFWSPPLHIALCRCRTSLLLCCLECRISVEALLPFQKQEAPGLVVSLAGVIVSWWLEEQNHRLHPILVWSWLASGCTVSPGASLIVWALRWSHMGQCYMWHLHARYLVEFMERVRMPHRSRVAVHLLRPYHEDFLGCVLAELKPPEWFGYVTLTYGVSGIWGSGSGCFGILINFYFSPYPLLST